MLKKYLIVKYFSGKEINEQLQEISTSILAPFAALRMSLFWIEMRENNQMNDIMVSICCLTYNHEKYISNAIDGFLLQETDFKYEILIHDDASTDNTAEIIKEYEMKYPDIIIPIYQTENQYSRKVKIGATYLFPKAKGKYVALCEGDDYWTDPLKLQTQVKYMESNPYCSLCVHAAQKVSERGKVLGVVRPSKSDVNYSTDDVILGAGGMFPTNSMFFPKKLLGTYPTFYMNAPTGDYSLTIFLSLHGSVHYIDKFMSVYRCMAEGSWNVRMKSDKGMELNYRQRLGKMLCELNEYTNYQHQDTIEKYLLKSEISYLLADASKSLLKSHKYAKFSKYLTIKQKVIVYLKSYFPHMLNKIIYIKSIVKSMC